MLLGDLLIAHNLVTPQDVQVALERQRTQGGLFGQNLVAMGKLSAEQLQAFLDFFPGSPSSIPETGLNPAFLLGLAIKLMYTRNLDTPSRLSDALCLPLKVTYDIVGLAKDQKLLDALASAGSSMASELRFGLSSRGKEWALEALEQSQYAGPAPVPLSAFTQQMERQSIRHERVGHDQMLRSFSGLVLSESLIREFGPAVNSGRSILIYGPPGNGKTSIAEAIGRTFGGIVHVPHAFEVDGQIVKVFDPTVHTEMPTPAVDPAQSLAARAQEMSIDKRWVTCRRPVVIGGGELTLPMLDLGFSAAGKMYEAPLQLKAMNGVFLIDDFGRQAVSPKEILNRWIFPLQNRIDYLALNTGRKFAVPFDSLLIFSTNLSPLELMDEAFLRRIPYKILMPRPTLEEYCEIFRRVCRAAQVELPQGILEYLVNNYYRKNNLPFASNHPRFILDCIIDYCRYANRPPLITPALVNFALRNLSVTEADRPAAPT